MFADLPKTGTDLFYFVAKWAPVKRLDHFYIVRLSLSLPLSLCLSVPKGKKCCCLSLSFPVLLSLSLLSVCLSLSLLCFHFLPQISFSCCITTVTLSPWSRVAKLFWLQEEGSENQHLLSSHFNYDFVLALIPQSLMMVMLWVKFLNGFQK